MDYEEMMLQITDVLKANNRYRLGDFEQAVKLIREIVTPKGKWIKRNGYVYDYRCSCCEYIIYNGKTNFCPYCGADMRGDV